MVLALALASLLAADLTKSCLSVCRRPAERGQVFELGRRHPCQRVCERRLPARVCPRLHRPRPHGYVSSAASITAVRQQVGLVLTAQASRRVACTGGWDWLATWAHLGGVDDVTDHKAAAAGLPPVDSLSEPVLACRTSICCCTHAERPQLLLPALTVSCLDCVSSLRSDSVAAQHT